jgi:asparagine synthase (glutamine-hydrolysing)
MDNNLLPKEVLWRNKEAFSDGVSCQNRSWFEVIQEKLDDIYSDEVFDKKKNLFTYNPPQTKEQLYYREIFEYYYEGRENVIPYFWMPKYSDATDSSARFLQIYKNKNNLETIRNEKDIFAFP